MNGINQELNSKIKEEVLIKKSTEAARELVEIRRPKTRASIEMIQEERRLREGLALDC